MMANKEFTKSILPYSLKEVQIIEGNGFHYFEAFLRCGTHSMLISKYLILQLVKIEGKLITEDQLNEMHIRDVIRINEIVNTMMSEI